MSVLQVSRRRMSAGALLLLAAGRLVGCDRRSGELGDKKHTAGPHELRIGVASSMLPVLQDVKEVFEEKYPSVTLNLVAGGSSALARQVTDLHTEFDLLVLADVAWFDELRASGWAKETFEFARSRLVLAQAPHVTRRLTAETWFQELQKKDVVFGLADPEQAPLGYRSVLALQLEARRKKDPEGAQNILDKAGQRFIWPHASTLAAHLQAGEIDYALLYAASALQFKLKFAELSPEVNLGDIAHAKNYQSVEISVVGTSADSRRQVRGALALYGVALGPPVPFLEELGQVLRAQSTAQALEARQLRPVN